MAVYASKQFNGASYGVRGEYVLVQQIEKDIANNRSKLGITFCVHGENSNASLFLHYATDIDVAGQNVFDYPETQWYGSGSPSNPKRTFPACVGSVYKEIWVNHDTYGNCTINVYFYTGIFSSSTKGNYGGSMTLENIPRASTPTTSGTTIMGNQMTIYTNRAATAFTHTIKYAFGNASGTIATSVGDNVTWTVPVNLAHQVPNATSGTGTITCETYNGSTHIGTKTCSFTLNVPSNLIPTASVNFSEADATMISKGWGVYVKDKSKLAVTVTGGSSYSSGIKSYASNVQGTSYSGAYYTSNILTTVGTSNVTATVTDNRGRTSSTTTKSLTVIDYFKPKINTAIISRCNESGIETDDGEYLLFSFAGEIAPVSNKNAKTFRLGYREKGADTSYTWLNVSTSYTVSSTSVIITDSAGIKQFSNDVSYDIRFEAIDSFETVYILREIGTGFDLINLNASGNSLAIGKISEADPDEKKLEIALKTEMSKTSWTCTGGAIIGAKQALSNTLPELLEELRVTNGQIGSVNFTESYTANGAIIHRIWYNYIWIPHRHGGTDGNLSTDDNSNFGTLLLYPMTGIAPSIRVMYYSRNIWHIHCDALDAYPIGSLYISLDTNNPRDWLGGEWTLVGQGRTLVGVNDNDADFKPVGKTGGSKTHRHWLPYLDFNGGFAILDTSKVGKRDGWTDPPQDPGNWWFNKTGTTNAASGGSQHGVSLENGMPPYLAVYFWKRIA